MKTSGLDVHKDTIFCASYDGKSYFSVKEFSTMTVSIRLLSEYWKSKKLEKVAMESTVTCWIPICNILWIAGKNGHYLLALKKNQQELYEDGLRI
ncbi:MAG: hypothetical protein LBV41_00855 [Cytophagaceae bacterium]|jgi:hypothetical protein|nr:hypothetical protein [Cytophagaceae bacterium]